MSVIQKIDSALETYYEDLGRKDFKTDGTGKFEAYCNDNGFGDDDIADELKEAADCCMLVEFDKDDNDKNNFPLNGTFKNEKKRQKAILNILKYINDNGKAPPAPSKQESKPKSNSKLKIKLYIPEEKVKKITDDIYKKQLSCLGKIGSNEPDLMYFFAVGYFNNMPFLTWMVDAYSLDKTKDYIENIETNKRQNLLTLDQWIIKNQFMIEFTKKDQEKAKQLKTAMVSYSYRIMSRLQYTPPTKINDNIKEIVDYISAVPPFLNRLIKGSDKAKTGPPFCIDVSFAVKVQQHIGTITPAASNASNASDEYGSDDDDDDDNDGNLLNPNDDHVGDLQKKLTANKLIYDTQNVPNQLDDLQDDDGKDNNDDNKDDNKDDKGSKDDVGLHGYSRLLMKGYNDFRTKLDEKKEKDQHDPASFPRGKRFGILFDRRKIKENNKTNDVTFFEQLGSCNNIPNGHIAEWYMEAARQCIIPGKGNKNITAIDSICGQLITFSFHVEADDDIKCYIIWNGQTMRFKGDNIGNILSYLFVDNKDTKGIRDELAQFDQQLTDYKFDDFYEKINNGYMHEAYVDNEEKTGQ